MKSCQLKIKVVKSLPLRLVQESNLRPPWFHGLCGIWTTRVLALQIKRECQTQGLLQKAKWPRRSGNQWIAIIHTSHTFSLLFFNSNSVPVRPPMICYRHRLCLYQCSGYSWNFLPCLAQCLEPQNGTDQFPFHSHDSCLCLPPETPLRATHRSTQLGLLKTCRVPQNVHLQCNHPRWCGRRMLKEGNHTRSGQSRACVHWSLHRALPNMH